MTRSHSGTRRLGRPRFVLGLLLALGVASLAVVTLATRHLANAPKQRALPQSCVDGCTIAESPSPQSNGAANDEPECPSQENELAAAILRRIEEACAEEDESKAAEAMIALGRRLRTRATADETAAWVIHEIDASRDARARLLLACALTLYRGLPASIVVDLLNDSRIPDQYMRLVVVLTTMGQLPPDWTDATQARFWNGFFISDESLLPEARKRWFARAQRSPAGQDGAFDDTGAQGFSFPLVDSIPRTKASDPETLTALFQRVARSEKAGDGILRQLYGTVDLSAQTTTTQAIRLYAEAKSPSLRRTLVRYIEHAPVDVAEMELERILAKETDEHAKVETVRAICGLDGRMAETMARRLFEKGEPPTILKATIDGLALQTSATALETLWTIVSTDGSDLKAYALSSLRSFHPHSNTARKEQIFLASLDDPDSGVRLAALLGLGVVGGDKYRDRLKAAASSDPSEDIRRELGFLLEGLDKRE